MFKTSRGVKKIAPKLGIALLAVSLMGAERLGCKEKVEVALMCEPAQEAPVMFGLGDLGKAMAAAGLVPRYVQPEEKNIKPRYLLAVGTAGRDRWLEPYIKAAKLNVPAKPESFVAGEYRRKDRRTVVLVGSDSTGTMYGLLEVAERVSLSQLDPEKPLPRISGSPFLEVRGVNPFLTLPAPGEADWWFLSEDFWRGYLDLLARSRINFLDLHGMYDIVKTTFPNIYPYFVRLKQFPDIGESREATAHNLAMLERVIELAKDRGIRVGIMSYSAGWKVPGGGRPMRHETEEALATYTRQTVGQMITACPELAMIGFRVGESGRKEDFYKKSYLPGISESGRKIGLYTRTWGARKEDILAVGQEYRGRFAIEIKYNGEQLGAPYIVAGGRMAGWRDYSYQTYLDLPRPYRVIWQIRANGTHRIFHWGDPRFVRRAIVACSLGDAAGFVVEPMNAYYPQRDYFHLRSAGHDYFKWVYERDWFWNRLWGRLAYDPDTTDSVWIGEFVKRFGQKGGPRVFDLVCEMSQVVPLIYQAHSLGPDHRNMAPELETGGDVAQFARSQPFDTFAMQTVQEFVTRQLLGKPTAKMSPLEAADALERVSKQILQRLETLRGDVESGKKEYDCIKLDAQALAYLAQYYAEKLRAGTAYAFYEATADITHIDEAIKRADLAKQAWGRLASVTVKHYRPFLDTLRMHSVAFHWQTEGIKLEKDAAILQEAKKKFEESVPGADDPIYLAHTPPRRTFTGRSFDLSATIATRAKGIYPALKYRQAEGGAARDRAGSFNTIRMLRTKTNEYVYETHLGSTWTPGKRIEYYIEVSAGKKFVRFPQRGETNPLSVLITDDRQGPEITVSKTDLKDTGPGRKELTVAAKVSDKGRVEKVWLWHKPLPSEVDWRYAPMQLQGGLYVARVPVKAEGLLYAIEAVDDSGNGTRCPDFRNECPYRVVEPWASRPAEREEDLTGFKEIARRDLSPERYAAMLVGAQAATFNAQPAEAKKLLLDRVAEGLSLVIFSQNAPKDADLSWLPGRIAVSGEGYRACKLTGASPLLDSVQREFKGSGTVASGLVGGEKEWKHYSEPKAIALCKLGKGVIVLCQVRNLEMLHNLAAFRLFENILTVAAGDRAGKPFVVMDKGDGRLLTALELADKQYVLFNEVALLAQPRPQVTPPTPPPAPTTEKVRPPTPQPPPPSKPKRSKK
jgi:hypothetical protein